MDMRSIVISIKGEMNGINEKWERKSIIQQSSNFHFILQLQKLLLKKIPTYANNLLFF